MSDEFQFAEDFFDRDEERDVFFGIINRFIGFQTHASQRHTQNDKSIEYPFVPMDTRQMFYQIKLARDVLRRHRVEQEKFSFMDIGCGIGNVLVVAEQMEFEVFGIEKDTYPFAIAEQLFDEGEVRQEDIWRFNDYGRFDVIYYFRPFHDGPTQRRFERMIEDRLKVGGILIANRKMDMDIHSDSRFRSLSDTMPVWEKISANALRDETPGA